jgi:hypothetical protein
MRERRNDLEGTVGFREDRLHDPALRVDPANTQHRPDGRHEKCASVDGRETRRSFRPDHGFILPGGFGEMLAGFSRMRAVRLEGPLPGV